MNRTSQNAFEIHANRYDQWFENHPAAYVAECDAVGMMIQQVAPHGRGLEIGTGTGRFSIPFGIREGVEPAAAMRNLANNKGLHIRDAKAEALPFPEDSFDFALMVTTICFVEDPLQACHEARRIVKPNGWVIMGLVDKDSFLGKFYDQHRGKSPFYREARFFSALAVTELMSRAGLISFRYLQTLFHFPDNIETPEPVREGFGEGGFVVIAGRKPEEAKP